jgi:hypothetical protein
MTDVYMSYNAHMVPSKPESRKWTQSLFRQQKRKEDQDDDSGRK